MNDLIKSNTTVQVTRTPDLIAVEINSIKDHTRQTVIYSSIEIGRRLVEAKEMLQHGEWGEWLEKSVDYSQRTANNLMKIYKEYGSNQITSLSENANSQTFANLSYSQAIAMLAIPLEEREEFVKDNDVESMSTRELQQAIKEKNEALEKLKNAKETAQQAFEENEKLKSEKEQAVRDARVSEQVLRETQKDVKALQQALEKEKNKSQEEVKKLQSSINELKKQFSEANNVGDTEEATKLQESLERLMNELNKSNMKIEELERQLQDKPIDVITATQEVEKIPEEIERELLELREKVNKPTEDKATTKFTFQFEELVKKFKEVINTLPEIEDGEKREKYMNAVKGLIRKMEETLNDNQ